jgi:hypothetical protein
MDQFYDVNIKLNQIVMINHEVPTVPYVLRK